MWKYLYIFNLILGCLPLSLSSNEFSVSSLWTCNVGYLAQLNIQQLQPLSGLFNQTNLKVDGWNLFIYFKITNYQWYYHYDTLMINYYICLDSSCGISQLLTVMPPKDEVNWIYMKINNFQAYIYKGIKAKLLNKFCQR